MTLNFVAGVRKKYLSGCSVENVSLHVENKKKLFQNGRKMWLKIQLRNLNCWQSLKLALELGEFKNYDVQYKFFIVCKKK